MKCKKLLLTLGLLVLCLSTVHADISWVGDAAGGGKRALVRAYLGSTPGYGHLSANTESYQGGWLLKCYRSTNDTTWTFHGNMALETDGNSHIGTVNFLQIGTSGTIYAAVEHHTKPNDANLANRVYRIEVIKSTDYGVNWAYDSTVAVHSNSARGYWAPFLLEKSDGTIQCYYDDEYYPVSQSRDGQQCISMETYNSSTQTWGSRVTVAFQDTFSRDGMPTVVDLGSNELICIFESPYPASPYNTRICKAVSTNGGSTWGAQNYVYSSPSPYHALCPYACKTWDGDIAVVFSTDEDVYPSDPGDNSDPNTLACDIKYITSPDGDNWSVADYVAKYSDYGDRNLLWPGIALGRDPDDDRLVIQFERYNYDYKLRHGYED